MYLDRENASRLVKHLYKFSCAGAFSPLIMSGYRDNSECRISYEHNSITLNHLKIIIDIINIFY
jgi:hypothetical protein